MKKSDPEKVSSKSLIVDFSHMLRHEESSPMHLLYVLLFGTAAAAALWQHGSAFFTFGVLGLLPLAGLFHYIPYRFINTFSRQMLSCLIFFGACFWVSYRLQKTVPFDLALLEGLILCCFSFLVNCTFRNCHYLFFITVFLVIYAGLIPRKLLLYLIPGITAGLFLLFWAERKKMLAGGKKLIFASGHSPFREFFRSWHLLVLHLLIAFPIFLYIFSLFPLTDSGTQGYFEVSFITNRTSSLPPDLRKWLRQERKAVQDDGGDLQIDGKNPAAVSSSAKTLVSGSDGQLNGSGSAPPGDALLFTVQLPLKLYHLANLYDVYDGKIWHTSKLLVKNRTARRKRSSQYHFDVAGRYTMLKWISPVLYAPYQPLEFQSGIQEPGSLSLWYKVYRNLRKTDYNIRFKNQTEYPAAPFRYQVSSRLTVPALPRIKQPGQTSLPPPQLYASLDDHLTHQLEKEKEKQARIKAAEERQRKLALARKKAAEERQRKLALARKKAQKKSGKKTVTSKTAQSLSQKTVPKKAVPKKIVPKKIAVKKAVPKKPAPRRPYRPPYDPTWPESLPKTHFLQLPEKLSPRIGELAQSITKDKLLPYEKAIALRDHLRNNYKYKLYAEPTPADKESVEYFLFELKEGHCEYFAAALTVLARSQNLPARVATGFSPGNYNALTRMFEVYEYHAHAWAQIYIAPLGWLTFDAVPPGDIRSETTPLGLGRLRDPFGDDWKVSPPELTAKAFKIAQELFQKELKEKEAEKLRRALAEKHKAQRQLQKTQKVSPKKVIQKAQKAQITPKVTITRRVKEFFKFRHNRFSGSISRFVNSLSHPGIALAAFFVLAASLVLLYTLLPWMKTLFYCIRLNHLCRQAQKEVSPRRQILLVYKALRILLLLGKMPRKNNQELLAYAAGTKALFISIAQKQKSLPPPLGTPEAIEEKAQLFAALCLRIFNAFYALEYGNLSPSPQDTQQLLQCLKEILCLLHLLYPRRYLPRPFDKQAGK